MEISSNFSIGSIQGSKPANRSNAIPAEDTTVSSDLAPVDQLDLSPEAQALSASSDAGNVQQASSDIRTDKVAALRRAIADGTYDTEDRMSAALDKLLEKIG